MCIGSHALKKKTAQDKKQARYSWLKRILRWFREGKNNRKTSATWPDAFSAKGDAQNAAAQSTAVFFLHEIQAWPRGSQNRGTQIWLQMP